MSTISVLIPFYGTFSVERARACLASVMMQGGVDIEIVVSEEGQRPIIEPWLPQGARYVFTRRDEDSQSTFFNPGAIRNRAFAVATGEYIYTVDADIVLQHSGYLRSCADFLSQYDNVVLRRPRMRRLVLEDVPSFIQAFDEHGIERALARLDRSSEYLATMDGRHIPLKVWSKVSLTDTYVKTFTASFARLSEFGTESHRDSWPQVWWENLHCGGNFLRREHMDTVAWYCEEFRNWGCEDSDLQWKLEEMFRVRFFPYTQEFEVLHLDHSKDYFSQPRWDQNEAICSRRREQGVEAAIRSDRTAIAQYKSRTGARRDCAV